MTTNNTIQVRRATAAAFTLLNPVLADGEPGYETDTRKIKYGNGVTPWNSLAYTASAVESVAGRTGAVVLNSGDISNFSSAASAAAPVQSVAGRTGNVVLNAADITNFTSAVPVQSVAGRTGNVVLTAADVSGVASLPTYSTWTPRTLPANASWQAAVYGQGKFVAIASNSAIAATSPDGITWTQRSLPVSANWSCIAFGNNVFVAVARSSNIVATSVDGITWVQRTLSATTDWSSICFGANIFYTRGSGTTAAISADGITWTTVACPSATYPNPTPVRYYKGKFFFVMGGYPNSTAYYSSDCITWTQTSTSLPRNAGNGFAVGNNTYINSQDLFGGNTISYSSDFVNWTQIGVNGLLPDAGPDQGQRWTMLEYGNGVFVIIVRNSNMFTNVLYNTYFVTSSDGVNWSLKSSQPFDATGICYGNGTFLVLGQGNSVMVSTEKLPNITGLVTDISAAAPVQSVAGKTGVVTLTNTDVGAAATSHTHGNITNAGAIGSTANLPLITTTNGVLTTGSFGTTANTFCQGNDSRLTSSATLPTYSTWTQRTIANGSWYRIAHGKGTFVAVAASSASAATSPDGITWTTRTLPSSQTWQSLTYGYGLFVTIGRSSAVAATSPDGITWTQRTIPNNNWWSVVAGNNVFVAVGPASSGMVSPDGVTWMSTTLPTATAYYSVTYGNGTFVAVGWSGTVAATSTDGITWTQRTLPASANWYAVAYGKGTFVAVAAGGTIAATSPDGITWTQRTLPVSAEWRNMAYGNGIFIAIDITTNSTIAATSPDGVTWTQISLVTPPTNYNWQGIGYGNGIFAVVGGSSTAARAASSIENLILANSSSDIENKTLINNIPKIGVSSFFAHGNSGSAKTLASTAAVQTCSLSANCTFTMPTAISSDFILVLTQTGSFTAAFTGVKWPGGVAPTITTGANKVDVISFVSDGTSWYGQITQNY